MKKIKRLAATGLALLLLLNLLPGAALAATPTVEWAGTYTHRQNNAVVTAPIPNNSSQFVVQWDAAVGQGAIAIVGDYVYTYNGSAVAGVAGEKGVLYKVDKADGTIKETLSIGQPTTNHYGYCFYANDLLYISCTDAIVCVDISGERMTQKWVTTHTNQQHCSAQYINGTIVANGLLFNAETGAQLFQVDAEGKPTAQAKTLAGSYFWSSGAEVDGYFYVAASDCLYAYDTTTWDKTDELEFKTGSGSGVMYHNGRVYWAGGSTVYCVEVYGGEIRENTLKSCDWGYTVIAPPVALGGRVYFAGTQESTDATWHTGYGAIGVFRGAEMSLLYNAMLDGVGHKLQTVPILRSHNPGSVVAGLEAQPASADLANAPQAEHAYVYVQDYKSPSTVYMLHDYEGQTSGKLEKMIQIGPRENFAFEQMACDRDGALYCINDSGYLVKYSMAKAPVPVIVRNLDSTPVTYELGSAAKGAKLIVDASVTDGKLTYQWQSCKENGDFSDIPQENEKYYTPTIDTAGTTYYRCVVTNTVNGVKARAYSNIAMITVTSRGDLDGDGKLTVNDVDCLRQHLAGKDVSAENGDVNKDGNVNLVDLVLLRRHVVKDFSLPE